MGYRATLSRRTVVAALAAAAIPACVAIGAPGSAQDDPAKKPSAAFTSENPDFAAGEQRAKDRHERLARPEARAERLESRTANHGLTREEARKVALTAFKAELDAPGLRQDRPADGTRLVRALSKHDALVEDDTTHKRFILRSTVPIRARNRSGDMAPVDLSLDARGNGFAPHNGPVAVDFADTLAGGVKFGTPGFGFHLVGADAHAQESAAGLFFANVAEDADFAVRPTPAGAESYVVIRSQTSPERYALQFDLPRGATLRRPSDQGAIEGDPPRSIEIASGDKPLGYVYPPVAYDADGTPVETSMSIDGSRVVINAVHAGRDLHYPLLVDPEVVEYGWFVENVPEPETPWSEWAWSQQLYGGTSNFGSARNNKLYAPGLYQSMPTGAAFKPGAYAHFYYRALPNTYVYRAVLGGQAHKPFVALGVTWSRWWNGIMKPTYGFYEDGVSYVNEVGNTGGNPFGPGDWAAAGVTHDFCFVTRCDRTKGGEQNFAVFGLQAYNRFNTNTINTGSNKASASMEWANVFVGDRQWPQFTSLPQSATSWTNKPRPPITVTDLGTGIDQVSLNGAAQGGFHQPRCGDGCSPWLTPFTYAADYTPQEGISTISASVLDLVGNGTAPGPPWTEKYDTAIAKPVLSGDLMSKAGQRIADGTYDLTVNATDSDPSGPRSGVKSLTVEVDGVAVAPSKVRSEAACDSCPLDLSWKFRTERFGAGEHTVAAVATDYAGNKASSDAIKVTVTRGATADVGPGTVSLRTGNLQISRDDVEIPSFTSALSLSRTYNSRDGDADPNGAFGPGWVSSLPVDDAESDYVQLVDTADAGGDGTVDVTTSDGSDLSFDKTADGYAAPPEVPELTLAKAGGSFELRDSDGNVTVFTKPTADPAVVAQVPYRPTQVRQPGTANDTTLSYSMDTSSQPPVSRVSEIRSSASSATGGSRYLTLTYGSSSDSLATGTAPAQWGAYVGRLKEVKFSAYNPATSQVETVSVAQYSYDNAGRLRAAWDPRTGLKETYDYDSRGLLTQVAPPGVEPWALTYTATTSTSDFTFGRLLSASRPTTGTWTVAYGVPVSGSGALPSLGASVVAAWGQTTAAVDATAIFPPDQVPATPPTSWTRATIHYLDAEGHDVNVLEPGGSITAAKYDDHDNVVWELTAANRQRAMASANPAQTAADLRTERTYSPDGTELRDEKGPLHTIQLQNGQKVQGRTHTVTTYNEGAPAQSDGTAAFHLPTTTTVSAWVGGADTDARVTQTQYDWSLRKPTATIVDPNGARPQMTRTLYNSVGLAIETRMPSNTVGGDASATQIIYYTAEANASGWAQCGSKPWWANRPCVTTHPAQPGGTLPPLMDKTVEAYDLLFNATRQTESAGGTTKYRTIVTGYDAAGRKTSESVTSNEGAAVGSLTYGYYAATGQLATTTLSDGGTTRTISRAYDTVGRQQSYTDADGVVSTTTYDQLDRPVTVNDGKRQQTLTYYADTGLPKDMIDPGAGTFTAATYDADGNLLVQQLPNGLEQQNTYDESGKLVKRSYVKTTNCTSNCTWLTFEATDSAQGQRLAQRGTLSNQDYSYDTAGRLTRVDDRPTGAGCTVRIYDYDLNSNRTASTTRAPAADGSCAPSGGTVNAHTYDTADRISDAGYAYDAFGRITSVPAKDTNDGVLTTTYFANDRVASQSQAGTTNTYGLDPEGRVRTRAISGPTGSGSETLHFSDASDSPAWAVNATATAWSRYVSGMDGNLAAIDKSNGQVILQLTNLHGDVVGDVISDPNATKPRQTFETDEFGVPRQFNALRYSWLGGKQRATELRSGVIQMGVRSYVPTLGRFLQTDPVKGGSANAYEYGFGDCVNNFDLDGMRVAHDPAPYLPSCKHAFLPGPNVKAAPCSGG
jgi:RHS repeat-associated protein